MNDLTFEQVEKLIEKAKHLGVDEFETMGLRVKFKPTRVIPKVIHKDMPQTITNHTVIANPIQPTQLAFQDITEAFKPMSPLEELTAEEILYYATPHFDEIQAQKEEHKKKLQGEAI